MRTVRSILKAAVVALGMWVFLCAGIGIVAVESALHPGRNVVGVPQQSLAREVARRNGASLADVLVTSDDGAILSGWVMRPAIWNGNAIVLLHGQADNRAGMLGKADVLLRHGYAVLLPDARAQGTSGGAVATYGLKEAGDLRRWFDWLHGSLSPHCIDGLGESMGSAQLLESLSAMPGWCAVVAEAPFATFREAAYDRLGQAVHGTAWIGRTVLRPAVEAGFLFGRWKYGVDLGRDAPEDSVAASRVPVLLIHGDADFNLPVRHANFILNAAGRGRAIEIWNVPGAGHCGAQGAAPDEFERRVIAWFERYDHYDRSS